MKTCNRFARPRLTLESAHPEPAVSDRVVGCVLVAVALALAVIMWFGPDAGSIQCEGPPDVHDTVCHTE